MRKEIRQWMDDGTFKEGVDLYRKYGENPRFQAEFDRYASSSYVPLFFRKKLRSELQDILNTSPSEVKTPSKSRKTTPKPTSLQEEPRGSGEKTEEPLEKKYEEPAPVKKLRKEAKYLHKQHSERHKELKMAGSDRERFDIAQRIMNLIEKLDQKYDDIRYFKENGRLPRRRDNNQVKAIVGKYKDLMSARTMASRYRKQLKKPKDKKNSEKIEKKLQAKEAEIERLEDELMLDHE